MQETDVLGYVVFEEKESEELYLICVQFLCHAIINFTQSRCSLPGFMITGFADSLLWRGRVTLTASGERKAQLRVEGVRVRVGPLCSGVIPIGCPHKFYHIVEQNVIGSARIACLCFIIYTSVLVENRPLVKYIRNYIRGSGGVFSIPSLVTSFTAFTLLLVQKFSFLNNKKKLTRWLEDMNLFCRVKKQYFTHSLRSFVKYRFRRLKIELLSSRTV